ncbi:hypothetical protein E2C01_014932 [Portunus trituberculatus]|uniref:Uncharacterized protein n=1 Tax=Portunus trituberculatus TaxID=210409 RepID=A0A5B7DKG6_PORTR|nr:hypothetical protein [Portunus trituberculatus]
MPHGSDDAEAVVAPLLVYRKSSEKKMAVDTSLAKKNERSVYHTLILRRLCIIAIKLNPDKSSILISNNTLH